jgi:hypothetical protein
MGILTTDQRFESTDIVELGSGVLMAILSNQYENDNNSCVYKSYSYDHGLTWSQPENINLPQTAYEFTHCNLFKVNSRIFLLLNRVGTEGSEGRIPALCYSDNNGDTWSTPQLILGGSEKEIVITNSRNITITNTGRIIIPLSYGQFGPNAFKVNIIYSDNGGISWTEGSNPFGGNNIEAAKFAEPAIGQLKDGRIIMLIRTALGNIYKSYSSDDGITWSTPVSTPLISTWTAHSIRITKHGYIVIAYTNAVAANDVGYPRNNLKFAVSYDNGGTWKESGTIIEFPDFGGQFVMEPNITYTINDQFLVTFYHMLINSSHRIETAIFSNFDVISDQESWENLQWWSVSGAGTIAASNDILHLADNTNTITSVSKSQIISPNYIFELRAKVNSFVSPGYISSYSTLGLQVADGNYRLMFKLESDGFYVIDASGSWIKYSNSTYLNNKNDWHLWRFEVFNGKTEVFMDGAKVIEEYDLENTSYNAGIISHWTSSTASMPTDCYIDYSFYEPL